MGQAAKELREMWRKRYRHILDMVFEDCASNKFTIEPDQAMDLMEELLEKLVSNGEQSKHNQATPGTRPIFRFDFDAYRREAHHYAVDRYYKTYFPRKRGAASLPTSYLDNILALRFKGLNYVAIAEKLGVPKDRMRKQVAIAERRWHEVVERIKKIGQNSPPQLVAKETAGVTSRKRTSQKQ